MINCEKCSKKFNTNWHLQRHYNKKRPCKEVPEKTKCSMGDNSTSVVTCECCCEDFSTMEQFRQHLINCKELQSEVKRLKEVYGCVYDYVHKFIGQCLDEAVEKGEVDQLFK